MSHTVASTLVDVLEKAGVKHIFGLIGDSLNPLADAVRHTKIEWIGVRNEEGAALAAAGQAKLVDAKSTNAAANSAATVAPQFVSQIEDAPARGSAPNISLRQSRRDALSMMAATAVCSIATEGIAASPASGGERDASTTGMSPVRLQAAQNAANSEPGPRFVPGRSIPVPTTASPEFQQTIAAPYRIPAWDADPKTSAEWKALVDRLADETVVQTRKVRDRLGVILESTVIDGVKAFVLTPKTVAASNRNRLLVHIHGGGYVYNPGEAATLEATLMAGYGGFKVISVDYRMPPDYPFPAGLDDAMRVWRSALKMHDPRNMAI